MERFLHTVDENEEAVKTIHFDFAKAIEANFIGPIKYLAYYEQYLYILNGTAEKELTDFFATEPFPYLKVS